MDTKTFTTAEVQKHTKPDDIWIVLHNKVYDVTKYQEDHPGGVIILREVAGRNATTEFEDVGHSLEANEELKGFYVGDLAEEEHVEIIEVYRPTFQVVAQESAITISRKRKQKSTNRLLSTVVGLGLTAGTGLLTYRSGFRPTHIKGTGWIIKTLRRISPLSSGPGQLQSAPGSAFWWGIGIATVVQVSLSVVFTLWAWSRFDVQEEFTHLVPRRNARPSHSIPFVKNPPSAMTKPSSKPTSSVTAVISPQAWQPFKLTRKTLVSPNVYKLVFSLPTPSSPLGLPTGQHIALRATINGKVVSRSYTPISNNNDLGRIELIIKVYDAGAMTQHLAVLPVGATIDIRGPKGAMQYVPNSYAKHIGMIAGGTGITPMYQVIRAICEDENDKTKIDLIYANNTVQDILLKKELDGFMQQCPDKFKVHYVVGKPPADGSWTGGVGFVTQDMMKEWLPAASEDTKMLLCGPPPMVAAMSKNLVGLGFKAPGTISKAVDQIFLF